MKVSVCMKGNIYTTQKCSNCSGKMTHDERRHNCVCHSCKTSASGKYYVKFGCDIRRRFTSYIEASRFLNGLRFKHDEGTLDKRDYQHDNPLSFKKQSEKWLEIKKKGVSTETFRKYRRFVGKMVAVWGERNVKAISAGDIEDFLYADTTAMNEKTRSDIRSVINQFLDWLTKREGITKPAIPKIEFELGYRTITDLNTQREIIAEVYRIASQPKIAFGIELLATYPKLRPDDLRRVTEADYHDGIITIHNPTKKKNQFKVVQLVEEHAEQWEEFKQQHPAMPQMPFFRHHNQSGIKSDSLYGKDLLYNWWKNACTNLGIEGLDLYGGTRHTTTTTIARLAGYDKAKKASCHSNNKAFLRYCQAEDKTAFEMAKMVRSQGTRQVHHKRTT